MVNTRSWRLDLRRTQAVRRGVSLRAVALVCVVLAFGPACDVEGTLLAVERLETAAGGSTTLDPNLPPEAVVSVAAGREHTCVLQGSGELVCWGEVVRGLDPRRIDLDRAITLHSAGERFHCVLDDLGDVYCFGDNDEGQLGVGDFESRREPARVRLPAKAVSVSAGGEHACAVLEDQRLYCWGTADESVLGFESDRERGEPEPVQVPGANGWSSVAACFGHSCALDPANALFCWGRNSDGQAGQPEPVELSQPTRVGLQTDWGSLACGLATSCGLRGEAVFCWGAFHQEDTSLREAPVLSVFDAPEAMLEGVSIVDVSTNTFSTCAVDVAGQLYCWGRGIEGQLGLGDSSARPEPTLVPTPSRVVDVSVGWFHVCVVYATGQVACTGENDDGQLGTGDDNRRSELTEVTLP